MKRFAQRYDVHVWLVAHPKQLMDWQGKAPSLYDISGSAHFINKADCGVVVHRCEGRSARQTRLKPFSACFACQVLSVLALAGNCYCCTGTGRAAHARSTSLCRKCATRLQARLAATSCCTKWRLAGTQALMRMDFNCVKVGIAGVANCEAGLRLHRSAARK